MNNASFHFLVRLIIAGIVVFTGLMGLKPHLFADRSPLEARDDYPRDRSFTINSKRYFLWNTDDKDAVYFNSPYLNDVYIIRLLIPFSGELADDKATLVQEGVPSGYSIFFKHSMTQFMLGLEQLSATFAVKDATNFPEIDNIIYENKNLYLLYILELGRILYIKTNFGLGIIYGTGKIYCKETTCAAAYPKRNAVEKTVSGYSIQLGFHFFFLELNVGASFFNRQTFELKSETGDKTLEFDAGNAIYYYGFGIRF